MAGETNKCKVCDYENAKQIGRATWICPTCGRDISLEYVLWAEAMSDKQEVTMQIFLSIDEGMIPSVWWGNENGCGAITLDKFFEESKIDMSKEMAGIYAEKFKAFAEELADYAGT